MQERLVADGAHGGQRVSDCRSLVRGRGRDVSRQVEALCGWEEKKSWAGWCIWVIREEMGTFQDGEGRRGVVCSVMKEADDLVWDVSVRTLVLGYTTSIVVLLK